LEEQRPRVAVPVDARGTAMVVRSRAARVERADLLKVEFLVRQEKHGSRLAMELARGALAGSDDRQAEQACAGVVEESVAPRFALACVRADIAAGGRGHAAEAQAGEMQVLAVAAH